MGPFQPVRSFGGIVVLVYLELCRLIGLVVDKQSECSDLSTLSNGVLR